MKKIKTEKMYIKNIVKVKFHKGKGKTKSSVRTKLHNAGLGEGSRFMAGLQTSAAGNLKLFHK